MPLCGEHISHMDLVNWATKTVLNGPLWKNLKQTQDDVRCAERFFLLFPLARFFVLQNRWKIQRRQRQPKFNSQFQSVAHSMHVTLFKLSLLEFSSRKKEKYHSFVAIICLILLSLKKRKMKKNISHSRSRSTSCICLCNAEKYPKKRWR